YRCENCGKRRILAAERRQNVAHGVSGGSTWQAKISNTFSPGGATETTACSVAPPGLCTFRSHEPMARAVGYILPPLRGCYVAANYWAASRVDARAILAAASSPPARPRGR